MHKSLFCIAAVVALSACAGDGRDYRPHSTWHQYDYNQPDPSYGGYYADRYYREDNTRYRERRLSRNDRIYRGQDGRFYCRRSDGTTGLIVGAIAGGVLGNVIAPGGSEELGTVLGAIAGGLAGQAIDRSDDVRCR
jgi:hypothetical protein